MVLIDDALVFAAVAAIPPLDRMESLLSMEQGHGVPPCGPEAPSLKIRLQGTLCPKST